MQPKSHTELIRITSRVIKTSMGLSWPLRMTVSLILVPARPTQLLHGLFERDTLYLFVVEPGDDVFGHNPSLSRWHSVERRNHLDQAVLNGEVDAEASQLLGCENADVRRFFDRFSDRRVKRK